MIRINLLPVRAVKKREMGQKQLVLFGLVFVIFGIGNYYWYAETAKQEERLRIDVQRTEKENKALEDKLKVLDTLERGRTGPVKMLDAMATSIPKNVWLKRLEEKGGSMSLDGSALTNDDLAEFMKSLANVVWTTEGMGRLVETGRKGATSRVELTPSGQIKDFQLEQIGIFFKDIRLKQATLRTAGTGASETKVVDFQLSLTANFAI